MTCQTDTCDHFSDAGFRVASRKTRCLSSSTTSAQDREKALLFAASHCNSSDVVCVHDTRMISNFYLHLSTIRTQDHMVGTTVEDNVYAGGSSILARKVVLQDGSDVHIKLVLLDGYKSTSEGPTMIIDVRHCFRVTQLHHHEVECEFTYDPRVGPYYRVIFDSRRRVD